MIKQEKQHPTAGCIFLPIYGLYALVHYKTEETVNLTKRAEQDFEWNEHLLSDSFISHQQFHT